MSDQPTCSWCHEPVLPTQHRCTSTGAQAFTGTRHTTCRSRPIGPELPDCWTDHPLAPNIPASSGPRVWRDDGHGCVERVHPAELAWERAYEGGLMKAGPE